MPAGFSRPALAFALAAALAGCGKPEPVIVLDSAWDAESAKSACEGARDWFRENAVFISRFGCERFVSCRPMSVIVNACVRDPVAQVREFEAELATQLAATPDCRSVRLINPAIAQGRSQAATEALKGKHWSLGLDFSPGAQKQQWTMTNTADQGSFTQGEGDAPEIAARICTLIRATDSTGDERRSGDGNR